MGFGETECHYEADTDVYFMVPFIAVVWGKMKQLLTL